ncbi:hypothetical protein Golomagni_05531, partial [Golovinomyces magnicellulatus]
QVRRLDAYLDRLPVLSDAVTDDDDTSDAGDQVTTNAEVVPTERLDELLRLVRGLSTASASQSLLPLHRVRSLLVQSDIASSTLTTNEQIDDVDTSAPKTQYEDEIEWLFVSKATVQVYGSILNTLLGRIIPLSDDIWYWSEILNSYTYSSVYTVQTSPIRLWAWTLDIYAASKARMHSISVKDVPAEFVGSTTSGLSQQWQQFYGIVRETITERSLANVRRQVLSPVALCRSEARRKRAQLQKLREITASGLGVLMDEGLQFGPEDYKAERQAAHQKREIERSIALIDSVLKEVCTLDTDIGDFEDKVFAGVQEDPELSVHLEDTVKPERSSVLARRLIQIIDKSLPEHTKAMQKLATENGRPSRLVRYWLPTLVGVLSSTTVLKILVNRQADIIQWITDFGCTVRDFWFNWVVEPTQKVIKTIRHDDSSDIAIMSRDSLKADRESLERMVVEFAMDKPQFVSNGSSLSDADISSIRQKVAEGDVTPVLRAFEKDLKSPFVGAIKGDLVRSLLIQVQKTKVDLEVAMTGIDSLLKSQELVFGFVGLTPGVLVSIGIFQYLRGVFGGRSGRQQTTQACRAVRVLRNCDRILSEARPTDDGILPYKDHGLLLCEVHVLRNLASKMLPKQVEKEFLEDIDDLANLKGIPVQAKALDRIRWAYGRWLM